MIVLSDLHTSGQEKLPDDAFMGSLRRAWRAKWSDKSLEMSVYKWVGEAAGARDGFHCAWQGTTCANPDCKANFQNCFLTKALGL